MSTSIAPAWRAEPRRRWAWRRHAAWTSYSESTTGSAPHAQSALTRAALAWAALQLVRILGWPSHATNGSMRAWGRRPCEGLHEELAVGEHLLDPLASVNLAAEPLKMPPPAQMSFQVLDIAEAQLTRGTPVHAVPVFAMGSFFQLHSSKK